MALRQYSSAVTVGTPIEYTLNSFYSPITIVLIPGNGGTMKLEYKVVDDSNWVTSSDGTVNSRTEIVIESPTRVLRFTATTTDGRVEMIRM